MHRRSLLGTEERRGLTLAAAGCEIRADGAGGAERFVGHAAVFDVRTAIGNPLTWGFYEEVAPGAFTKTISEGDARFLIDHDSYYVVARASAGTLALTQDSIGLGVDSALDADLSYVGDLKVNLRNKNITGMSFGFYVVKDVWNTETVETSDGQSAEIEIRRILEVRLIEVSAVTFPAYEETDAGLRHSLLPALRHRGDVDAVARRTQFIPELAELLDEMHNRTTDDSAADREPGESTRDDDTLPDDNVSEPADATRVHAPSSDAIRKARARVHAARIRVPA